MGYYILRNKKMPWGDYGDILFTGLLTVMDRNFNDLEFPEMERTGLYIPEIYIANSTNLVVVDKIKNIIEKSNLKGVFNFQKIIKKKIVNINWTEWDKNKESPLFYPKGGEPENYIIKNKDDEQLKLQMPDVWHAVIEKECTLIKTSEKVDNESFSNIALAEIPKNDIFIAKNMLFIVVSEKFKEVMDENKVETTNYVSF